MAYILSGENIAKKLLRGLEKKTKGKRLSLAVIQVGRNPVSAKYIAEKEKAARMIGIGFRLFHVPRTISQANLEKLVGRIAKDLKVTGMIVQLPLPKHINSQSVLDRIPRDQDVDVLSSASFGRFALGQLSILPPTVAAASLLLNKAGAQLQGAKVAVVGAGRLVGLPLVFWLLQQGSTVSVANKFTKNLGALTKQADVVISGAGKQNLITGSIIKKGAIVIDAGTSVEAGPSTRLRASKIKGDVDFKSVSKKAKFISPVPGGVGPLTVACLLQNLVLLAKNRI